jgi:hypothetical protein
MVKVMVKVMVMVRLRIRVGLRVRAQVRVRVRVRVGFRTSECLVSVSYPFLRGLGRERCLFDPLILYCLLALSMSESYK